MIVELSVESENHMVQWHSQGGALGARASPSALTHTILDYLIAQPQHPLNYSNLQVLCLTQLRKQSFF